MPSMETTGVMTRASAFFVGCVLLLCQHQENHFYASAQSDGNLWDDNPSSGGGGNSQYTVNTATATSRQDTSPEVSKKILLDLYSATGGYDWIDSSSWQQGQTSTDVCAWKGVFCYDGSSYPDRTGHIQQIDLSHNNLHGRLPGSVFGLPYLESLDFEGNQDLTVDFVLVLQLSPELK